MARSQSPPEGFLYRAGLLTTDEEQELICLIAELEFAEFEFRGYAAKRRVLSFGWHYDFGAEALHPADEIPGFLLPLRQRAAQFAGLAPEALAHALITEYSPGTQIGWHRDKGVFAEVIGVSLLSSCTLRLRRKAGAAWERYSLALPARSAYLLRGAARYAWEHSIPPVAALRYSITFRSLKSRRSAWISLQNGGGQSMRSGTPLSGCANSMLHACSIRRSALAQDAGVP